jgi:hypothetical protein
MMVRPTVDDFRRDPKFPRVERAVAATLANGKVEDCATSGQTAAFFSASYSSGVSVTMNTTRVRSNGLRRRSSDFQMRSCRSVGDWLAKEPESTRCRSLDLA